MGQQRKGLDITAPVCSLPLKSREEHKEDSTMTVLLEKCIPAALLKVQATAQLFVITNSSKEAFLGSNRTCLLQTWRTFWEKKKRREGEKKRQRPPGSHLFHSDFNHQNHYQIKCQLFPCSLTFDAYCTASFSAHRGLKRLKSQHSFYSGLRYNLNHSPERREGKGEKRLLAQSCLFSALHV